MRKKESTRTEGRSRNPRHKVVRRGEPLFRSLVHQDYTPQFTTYGTSGVTVSVQLTGLCCEWHVSSCANLAFLSRHQAMTGRPLYRTTLVLTSVPS